MIGSILASAGSTKASRIAYLGGVPNNAPTVIQQDCPQIITAIEGKGSDDGVEPPLKQFLLSAKGIPNTRVRGLYQMLEVYEKAKAQAEQICGQNGSEAVAYLTAIFKIANLAFSNTGTL